MLEALIGIIPVELKGPSIISLFLIVGAFLYLDRGQKMVIKEIANIKMDHITLKKDFRINNDDNIRVTTMLKTMGKAMDDIKEDIREIRKKAFK